MPNFPDTGLLCPQHTMSAWHLLSIGGTVGNLGQPASGTWPSANRAFFVPFRIPAPAIVDRFWCANGTVAGNNFDIGVYTEQGTKIASTTSTAQSGTSVIQATNVTDFVLAPGTYYLAMAMNGTTGTVLQSSGIVAEQLRAVGFASQNAAFALPATFTLVSPPASAIIPMFGYSERATV